MPYKNKKNSFINKKTGNFSTILKALYRLFLYTFFSLLLAYPAQAEEHGGNSENIAVLYPTVSKQYSHMFDQLIAGINSVPSYRFITYRVNAKTTAEDVKKWSQQLDIKGYIALGQSTYKIVDAIKSNRPLIAGGMVATPPGISGISLSGDPEAFFRHLQLLNPSISRVFFIYSYKNNGWLIRQARKISKKYNIEFIPLQVDDVKQATLQYQIVMKSIRPRTDAIWIPLDNVAPINILLPQILQTAWNQHITVFSNNLLHAKRGALFALFPDSYKQGRRLVALLQRHIENESTPARLYPTVDLKTAVNIKTANHLGTRYSREMIQKFDKVFPGYK